MAALSSFIVMRNDRYAHDYKDGTAVTKWRRPWIRVPRKNSVALCGFCGQKIWQQSISTKKCFPCTVNIACHVKQFSKSKSFGGMPSLRWRGGKCSVGVVPTANTRILRRRFPGTCETAGQVFKFVWRLRWKIIVVCMSLSPFVSFQSRFVTYLLTCPRIQRSYKRYGCFSKTWSIHPFSWCQCVSSVSHLPWVWKVKLLSRSVR